MEVATDVSVVASAAFDLAPLPRLLVSLLGIVTLPASEVLTACMLATCDTAIHVRRGRASPEV